MAEASKKESFRTYLETAGVLDSMTKSEGRHVWSSEHKSHSPEQDTDASIGSSTSHQLPAVPAAVLVSLYEEPNKPGNAVE